MICNIIIFPATPSIRRTKANLAKYDTVTTHKNTVKTNIFGQKEIEKNFTSFANLPYRPLSVVEIDKERMFESLQSWNYDSFVILKKKQSDNLFSAAMKVGGSSNPKGLKLMYMSSMAALDAGKYKY